MLLDMRKIIENAAFRAHLSACDKCQPGDPGDCKGPDLTDWYLAQEVIDSYNSSLWRDLHREVNSAVTAYRSEADGLGPADAMAVDPAELLAAWFRWWRDDPNAPAHLPGALHARTGAYLAARAVQQGRTIRTPQDV